MPQLLLEIFSEEIPARMQAQAARDLERMAREKLADAGLLPAGLKTYAGSRRLTLVADGLPPAQSDRSEERKGPRVGSPDQAIDGFLRSTGLTRDQLVERDGLYFAQIAKAGRPTADIVAEMVEAIVRGFPWPKSMRWGSGTLRWVRPIKRILCTFDGELVPFEIDGIASGERTEGHRFMGSGQAFLARTFDAYAEGLQKHFVVLDPEERKQRILEGARTLCFARNLELIEDDGLLDEVAGLSEWPTPLLGDMDPAFLDLPAEVIRTSMRTHQKYFAVRDPRAGKLAPHFLAVANIEAIDGGKAIAAGNARVLSARLNDARFFWDEDRKAGNFDRWNEKLKGVTFHAKLGTLAQRVERLEVLADTLAPFVGADPAKARQAAHLSKADLASGMVGEFPELQGMMGGYYAREAGLSAVVADAIADHYKPVGPKDDVPEVPVTMAVALADKIDTLVGFFAIGEKPTGSKDPYALRRSALGLIRILLNAEIRLPVRALVAAWYRALKTYVGEGRGLYVSTHTTTATLGANWRDAGETYAAYFEEFDEALLEGRPYLVEAGEDVDGIEFDRAVKAPLPPRAPVKLEFRPYAEVVEDISRFLADRLEVVLRDQGSRHDLVAAVFALGDDDLVRIVARVKALEPFLKTEDGANLLAGYKRAANILKAEAKKGPLPDGDWSEAFGHEPEELALFQAVQAARQKLDADLKAERFAEAMAALASLRQPVDAFFEKVLVNADDADVRANRLRLLGQVQRAMNEVADFSQIAG